MWNAIKSPNFQKTKLQNLNFIIISQLLWFFWTYKTFYLVICRAYFTLAAICNVYFFYNVFIFLLWAMYCLSLEIWSTKFFVYFMGCPFSWFAFAYLNIIQKQTHLKRVKQKSNHFACISNSKWIVFFTCNELVFEVQFNHLD